MSRKQRNRNENNNEGLHDIENMVLAENNAKKIVEYLKRRGRDYPDSILGEN